MSGKNKLLLALGVLLVFISLLYLKGFVQNQDLYSGLKCPDEYQTSEEYLADMDKFTNSFFDKNPGASLSDWAKEREVFWRIKGCDKAIAASERYKSGEANPETLKIMNQILGELITNSSSNINH